MNDDISHKIDKTAYFDCDETLVMWNKLGETKEFHIDGMILSLTPHKKHIDELKRLSDEGYTIIVWSQGGASWAHEVVRVLDLERYVLRNHRISKPTIIYDDLPATAYMPTRRYIDD